MRELKENSKISMTVDPEVKRILIELSEQQELTLTQFLNKMIKTNLRRIHYDV